MSDMDGLRQLQQQIAEALADFFNASRYDPPMYEAAADAVLPVVTAYAERRARERAAEELDALELIARGGCHVYVGNTRCSDPATKRIRGDRRLSSGWCDACIAADAIARAAALADDGRA